MALTQIPPVMIDGELGLDWQSSVETSSFTAATGKGYFVNTTNAGITVTMPSSPITGDSIGIIDYAGTTSTNNITLTSSNNIQASSDNKIINYNRGALRITYIDSTQGWVASAAANEGNSAINPIPLPFNIDYLIVGGGGGGGGNEGGGGGAGQYLVSYNGEASGGSVAASPSTGEMSRGVAYTVTVGEGGLKNTGDPTDVNPQNWTKGFNGASSVLNFEGRGGGGAITETAIGGGGGATGINYGAGSLLFIGADGASGGGGSRGSASYPAPRPGGSATSATTGYNGGSSDVNGNTDSSGGGGGAFGLGVSATSTGGFNGGSGATSGIDGNNTPRAGGGGGGGYSGVSRGTGASGGGDGGLDASTQATAGAANTGSGGGGGGGSGANTVRNGGDGGSGVVIIRYATSAVTSFTVTGTLNTPTPVIIGTDSVITFTTGTGTITFN